MDKSHIFRGRGPVCVCVCVCHTLTYLVYCWHLYIAVGNTSRQSACLKLAVRATCLFLTEAEMPERAERKVKQGGSGKG